MRRLEQLEKGFDNLVCSITGGYVYQMLRGFAEILDNSENVHNINTDLVDIYMVLSLKNGVTIQLTGQITEISMLENNHVLIRTEDRKVKTMPDSTFIFCLNDVQTAQSLDIVQHQKRLEARMEAELAASKEEKADALNRLFPNDPTAKVSITEGEPTNKEAEAHA